MEQGIDNQKGNGRCMKVYHGERLGEQTTADDVSVKVSDGDRSYPLDSALNIRNHSPTGMNWGYWGSGPAQLALAILVDCVGKDIALNHCSEFMRQRVGDFKSEWSITEIEIKLWLRNERAK